MSTRIMRPLIGAAVSLGIAVGVAGCTAGPRVPDAQAAGTVALAYTRALLVGDLAGAAKMVALASRGSFTVLTDGMRLPTLTATHLAVGRVDARGPAALVVLFGTFCDATQGARTPGGPLCVTNRDPRSCDPRFRVELASSNGGPWQVVLGGGDASRFAQRPVVSDPAKAGDARACPAQ